MPLAEFNPAVREWFRRRFGAPSPAQERGWPVIARAAEAPGHDVLLCAPTGSGKTLAAFMWAIDRLIGEAAANRLTDTVSVLYVSPLKALANDIRLNLEEPLAGVRAVAAGMGIELAPVRAGLRTGDTPASERNAMLRRPPHILVTTPESLFILLTSPRFREKLRAVRHVIVDELHAIAGDKRGAHLAITLERLERLVRNSGAPRPVRIGLSATLNPIGTLAAFLAGGEIDPDGTRRPRPVEIVRADDAPRALDLRVIAPGPELGPLATHQHWEAMYDAVAKLIGEHRTTLIFTLSRRWAERIALALQKRVGADAVMAHHGSLARAERLAAEQRLKRGELKAIVATASLELGIDVGAVDLVCQIDSPKSLSAAVQRVGRSGHQLGATPKGRFFALTIDDLIECAAAVRAIRAGRLDAVEVTRAPLDVAAQQIVAIAAEEEDLPRADLLAILRGAHNYAEFEAAALERLLAQMAASLPERIAGAAPKIFYDSIARRVRPRRGGRLAAITSGGTIPESGNYDAVIASEGRKIGDVEEDFAQESSRGDIFSLGSTPWRILGISKNRLLVEPAPGMAPSLPFWQTEAGGRSAALSAEVCDLRRRIAQLVARGDDGDAEGARWLVEQCALDENAAAQASAWIRRGVAALGVVPDERTIVVERFFDGVGGTQVVIHAPFGIRFNRGLGLAIRKRLCQSFDFEIQASAIDDGALLALNSRHSFELGELLAMVDARGVADVLGQAMLDAPMFEVRFRHVATRALGVMRSFKGRRVPAWIQRLRTQELIAAIFPRRNACFENRPPKIEIPDHFIVSETMRECLEESADAPRLAELLARIESGDVRVRLVDSVAPSVFAQRILLAWDYSFLDDGERADRRSRSVTMNRALAEEVFRADDLSGLIAAGAIAQIGAELAATAPGYRPRNADELHELIRERGALATAEVSALGEAPAALADRLVQSGRIMRMRVAPDAPMTLIAAEDAALFAAAYPDALDFQGRLFPAGDRPPIDSDTARMEIVRRVMATSVPATAAEIAERVAMPAAEVGQILIALESRGAIFRGNFTRPAPDPAARGAETPTAASEWCDRYVLHRLHRQTLSRLRAEVEPADERAFAAFRIRWFEVGAELPATVECVSAVLERTEGNAFTPAFWEQAILPARIAGYRPELLDLACASGAWRWVAAACADADDSTPDEFPEKIRFIRRRGGARDGAAAPLLSDPPLAAAYAALNSGGAQFLDELADRANLSERDALRALWRLAARGLASNDNFGPLRILANGQGGIDALVGGGSERPGSRRDAALRARLKSSLAGRWSAVVPERRDAVDPDAADRGAEEFDAMREIALALLGRHGVLTREMAAGDGADANWRDLTFALRRMEYAGTIRRGYFVRGLAGEQYALPEALEMLRAARVEDSSAPPIALAAADPANPYGALIPGCGVARDVANLIVTRAGRMILGLAGRALVGGAELDDAAFTDALAALFKLRSKLTIETIDGVPALESERVAAMAAVGFHSDGRALVRDGLPGPVPRRALASVNVGRAG